jgi:hypothetical protein
MVPTPRLGVASADAAGRKSPHNHAQTARNLRRSFRDAAAGARIIQAEGLDRRSAAGVAASVADALEELHRSSGTSIDVSDVIRDALKSLAPKAGQ